MPLNRHNITAASRVMLPTYVAFFALIGLNYIFGPHPVLAASPALAYADQVMPLAAWGTVFVACAVIMAIALVVHRRTPFRFALRLCALSMLVWASIIGLASLAGEASPAAAVWPAFVAVACFASDRSLATGER